MHALESARAANPISLQGVGLSLDSADRLVDAHLTKLKRLVDRVEPALVSEHQCRGGVGGVHFNALLPLPRTGEAVTLLPGRVGPVQSTLR